MAWGHNQSVCFEQYKRAFRCTMCCSMSDCLVWGAGCGGFYLCGAGLCSLLLLWCASNVHARFPVHAHCRCHCCTA